MYRLIAAGCAALLLVQQARAHSGYPSDCCAEQHCHPVPCDEMHVNANGWMWHDMEFVWQSVRASPDGRCHACHMGGTPVCIMPGGVS